MTPKQVLEFAKNKKIEMVDLKFMDFVGTWQHFAVPIYELQEDNFEDGFGFDGSSIRGWQPIHASDMLVIPDPDTAIPDPFIEGRGVHEIHRGRRRRVLRPGSRVLHLR
jgi:glutamine synthetase